MLLLLAAALSRAGALRAPALRSTARRTRRRKAALCAASSFAAGLPVAPLLPEVVASLAEQPNLVLEAPPGAGKTTAVPLALLEAGGAWRGDDLIIVLEPRRVAAKAAASRMASLLGEPCGQRVGYTVRHEAQRGRATRVLVMTEGVLVRMLQADPALAGVGCVVFDEFHERSVDADLCLALCREAQRVLRPELRLLVMSATLGDELAPAVAALLGECRTLTAEGRSHAVDVRYVGSRPLGLAASGHPREVEAEVAAAVCAALRDGPGDVLAFLPGEREIRGVEALLEEALPAKQRAHLAIRTLYGALPFEQQQAAISAEPDGRRRVVLSTTLAESSLTIEGVRAVVDAGLRRASVYDSAVGMAALVTRPVSAAAAAQRAGRAGRLAPGTAYRLWSEPEQARLAPQQPPEIATSDLAPLVLQLAKWGGDVADAQIAALPWVTPPPQAGLARARDLLGALGALAASDGAAAGSVPTRITPFGERLSALPTHPRLAHALLTSGDEGPSAVASAVVATLEVRSPPASRGPHRGTQPDLAPAQPPW